MKALIPGGLLLIVSSLTPAVAVDFEEEVLPIFSSKCFRCHGEGESKGGLSLEPDKIDKHIRSSKQIRPGDAEKSLLIELITTEDMDDRMPPKGPPLSEDQIQTLKSWIEDGAKIGSGEAGESMETEAVAEEQPAMRQPLDGTWTNADGKSLQGTLTAVEGDKAVLQIQGKAWRVPISSLSVESQEKIREWLGE